MRTVGVEEEFLLISGETGVPSPDAPRVVPAAVRRIAHSGRAAIPGTGTGAGGAGGNAEPELDREQVEIRTAPRRRLTDLYGDLVTLRRATAAAAADSGTLLAATATSPMPVDPSSSPGARYRRIVSEFGLTGREQLTCGCHVHVCVGSDEEAIGVLDRVRPWLALLLALSANSPFWQGEDSDYASYRTQVWGRWPTAGPTEAFGSADAYRAHVGDLLATGTILDEGMIYFDARPSARYPTIEVRVADVCLEVADAVTIAGLVRALVVTEAAAWAAGQPAPRIRTGLLRLAQWRASRSGMTGTLVDLGAGGNPRPVAARTAIDRLVRHVGDALDEHGDREAVTAGVRDILGRGTGAERQRAARHRGGDLLHVTRMITAVTVPAAP